MIINCDKRRLVSYRYGWKIEIQMEKEDGAKYWAEDRPAFPASLADGLTMICERTLAESGDTTPAQLPEQIRKAVLAVRKYMAQARSAA